jgi:hypothetical protein
MMIAAAMAATGLLVTQFIAFKRAGELSNAQAALGKAKEDKFAGDLEGQKQLTLSAQTALLELQKASLPRSLDVKRVAAKIRGFAGTTVTFTTFSDFEPSHTAALIAAALKDAGWIYTGGSTTSGTPPEGLSTPGVWVEPGLLRRDEDSDPKLAQLQRAANALVDALNTEGVQAKTRPLSTGASGMGFGSPDGAIHVIVSLRPMPGMPDDLRVVDGK